MTQLSLGIAIIGFACGMVVGARHAPHDRNAPASSGIIGAVLFFLASDVLITVAIFALCGLTMYFATRAWPTVHESLLTFARESGMRIKATRNELSIAERIAAMHQEHQSRIESIRCLALSPDDEEECLEMAQNTLRGSTMRLAGTDYSAEN